MNDEDKVGGSSKRDLREKPNCLQENGGTSETGGARGSGEQQTEQEHNGCSLSLFLSRYLIPHYPLVLL